MRRLGKSTLILSIPVVAMLVATTDVVLMPILLETYHQTPATSTYFIANDFTIVLLTGLAGLFLAPRVGCPIWWRPNDDSPKLRRKTILAVTVGVAIVIINTLNNLIYIDQAAQTSSWINLLTPSTAVAISLRAALNEEVIFRLFLFPLVAWILKRLKQSEFSLTIGALASSILFGLIHGAGFFWAFLVGLALIYIYYQRGLFLAMPIHFFADAISFVLISMMP